MKYVLVFFAGMIVGVGLLIIVSCCVVAGRSDVASERDIQEMGKATSRGSRGGCFHSEAF